MDVSSPGHLTHHERINFCSVSAAVKTSVTLTDVQGYDLYLGKLDLQILFENIHKYNKI